MNPEHALLELLAALEAERGNVVVSHADAVDWGDGAIAWLCRNALLKSMPNATSIECLGCEHRCISEVLTKRLPNGSKRFLVLCEEPDMQAVMGQVLVATEQLQRWRCDMPLLARVVASLLELTLPGKNKSFESSGEAWRLGTLPGKHGRHWASLCVSPLSLDVNQQVIPLSELLYLEGGRLVIDRQRIDAAVNAKTANATASRYTPNTSKRELKKLATEARYQSWRDDYAAMSSEQKAKGKKWCSQQIAKLPIADGKDYETIRRQLKN